MDDLAQRDRSRLDALLRVGTDPALSTAEPDPLALTQGAHWVVGFADSSGASISVLFLPDPEQREQSMAQLREAARSDVARVSANGALVFFGRAIGGDRLAEARLRELAGRFAGRE